MNADVMYAMIFCLFAILLLAAFCFLIKTRVIEIWITKPWSVRKREALLLNEARANLIKLLEHADASKENHGCHSQLSDELLREAAGALCHHNLMTGDARTNILAGRLLRLMD